MIHVFSSLLASFASHSLNKDLDVEALLLKLLEVLKLLLILVTEIVKRRVSRTLKT